jgi:hypothetical protein
MTSDGRNKIRKRTDHRHIRLSIPFAIRGNERLNEIFAHFTEAHVSCFGVGGVKMVDVIKKAVFSEYKEIVVVVITGGKKLFDGISQRPCFFFSEEDRASLQKIGFGGVEETASVIRCTVVVSVSKKRHVVGKEGTDEGACRGSVTRIWK